MLFELWFWTRLLRVAWIARRSNQSILKKSVLNIHWKDWNWSSNTLVTWCKELDHWKRPWCWERLRAGGNRGWDGPLTQWTWVWANSRRWWRTGKPGILQSVGLQESDMTEWLKTTIHLGAYCCARLTARAEGSPHSPALLMCMFWVCYRHHYLQASM